MLLILPTLWWLFFFTALGLCLGSFANVLIHRLPLDRSPREPKWSACPHCETRIRWHENIPVLSFLLLGGKCRNCKLPISVRYPVVELAMAIVFVALADAFLLAPDRAGSKLSVLGGTERLASDWPMLLAHLVLFFGLFVMSAIDLEHYWVDIRFTNLAAIVGFLMHIAWTPKASLDTWPRPGPVMAVASLAALAGVAAAWLLLSLSPWNVEDELDTRTAAERGAADANASRSSNPQEASSAPPPMSSPYEGREPSSRRPIAVMVLLVAAVWVLACLDKAEVLPAAGAYRFGLAALGLFALVLALGQISRPSDEQVYEEIVEESASARVVALQELAFFLPAVAFALLLGWLVVEHPGLSGAAEARLHWVGATEVGASGGSWQPLRGLATAACGFVVGGAVGWLVRILFTLLFGKEAFGTGDIHIMAAAGCVAGWPVVVLGFFLACFLAMIGWLAALPFKRTRAVPLGPWLSLAFLIVVLFYQPIVSSRLIGNVTGAVSFLLERTEVEPEPTIQWPANRGENP
ncbi:MAG: A24 family peptidase [Phycisphaerales bacterium]|nr:A24 family peptidase [Phycisphaerales bacterium]